LETAGNRLKKFNKIKEIVVTWKTKERKSSGNRAT